MFIFFVTFVWLIFGQGSKNSSSVARICTAMKYSKDEMSKLSCKRINGTFCLDTVGTSMHQQELPLDFLFNNKVF